MRLPRITIVALTAAGAFAGAVLFPLVRQNAQTGGARPQETPRRAAFRILLGVTDREPTVWDGSVKVSGGRIHRIDGWRFTGTDSTDSQSSWKVSSRHSAAGGAAARGIMVENGVIVTAELSSPGAGFDFQTARGSFSFKASEVPYGASKQVLDGQVRIDRVPPTVPLTTSEEDEDFPAVAKDGDDVYVAYIRFVHGDRSQEPQGRWREEPASFDFLARPVGGDQVFLMHYSRSSGTWDEPVPVTAAGLDIMRTAIALDGKRRVWVFWSANRNGNFDLYARCLAGGRFTKEIRLTSNPGTDLNPVAATDKDGRVWVAWQGFRNDNLEILAAVQDGDRFTPETVVSFSRASDWDPAIAAAPNGGVAISWDTYDKGDYDVYFRRLRAEGKTIRMDAPVPVAASRNFEARSSIAFDRLNRLWVAYEASTIGWGKDFGAYNSSGVALYQGQNVQVRCFQGDRAFATAEDINDSLPGVPTALLQQPGQGRAIDPRLPNPDLAKNRAPHATVKGPARPLNSFPRLAVDSEGTVYLAVRTLGGPWRAPEGIVWFEQLAWFNGLKWTGPVFVPGTDGLLDSRPALAALEPGRLLLVSAMDHRQSPIRGGRNGDIYAADFQLDSRPVAARLRSLGAETPASPDPATTAEIAQVQAMRDNRVHLGSQTYRLMRGEFHRHTEMSGDGLRDGPLIDAYRYLIDTAYMDWGGCCDHDNGEGHEYNWWLQQKLTDAYHLGGAFVPMFSYERSVVYPEGHRNVVFAQRGVRTLPRLPRVPDEPVRSAPDTQMLYHYLRRFDGIAASHTSGTQMGTDWRDNDPVLEPVVEIYQGDRQNYEMPGAPRSNSERDSIGNWRPLGFVSLALQKGYRLGFQASSDHISTHMSYCNLWVTAPTREAIMEAFHKRRVYGATDNILADVRCGDHFMGEEFATGEPPALTVKLRGTGPFAKVHIIKDGRYVYTIEPNQREVQFAWRDSAAEHGRTSYYYVRGEQADGELVWVSPMWIAYR